MDEKKAPGFRAETIEKNNHKPRGNDAETQVNRSLEALQVFLSMTTQDMRLHLDVIHSAGRIKELRGRGFEIRVHWENFPTASGRMHRMARYVYAGKKGGEYE
ncbi:helix-turn-helix domain-containing protein [Noviherbaspirillum autotrophicum]|uniref:Winged helix-turn-helix domain-containing protein n=1 Tax=Noviherbaspirillum autotrophicum TaxID=709839 RepID=A0A0C1Y664_9BURK|nr:helix-turn-helix domain-containing protein [Noviherbaspirillum autotrophicum]KIF82413.1 hypothetical protein TSA66_18895 [Noviherbaspirillum autotrophicum]